MRELSSGRHRRLSAGPGNIALSTALGLCLCAGQLATAQAGSAAAPAPVIERAPALTNVAATTVTPALRMSVSARTLNWGAKTRVTASIINPKTGKAVTSGSIRLQAWRNGAWRTWQTKRISSTGKLTFTTMPLLSGFLRVQYTGASGLRAVTSHSARVTVRASGRKVLSEAAKHNGARYVYGASGPRSFDCSGYTMYVYRKAAGKKLPHKANSQQRYGKAVAKSNKRVGDLIVFRSGSYGTHAAIYAGGGYMWAAPNSGSRVKKQKIYSSSYVVRRLV